MTGPRLCRVCRVIAPGATLPVLAAVYQLEEWHLCGRCWALLELGVPLRDPEARLAYFTDRRGLLLTTAQVWDSIRLAARQALPPHGPGSGWPVDGGGHAWPGVQGRLEADVDESEEREVGHAPSGAMAHAAADPWRRAPS